MDKETEIGIWESGDGGSPRRTLKPGALVRHYEVLELIGAGGMGEVYLARDQNLGREVALKMLPAAMGSDSERRARFLRESKLAASVSHPNIATIYEADEERGQLYYAMELVRGQTLRERVRPGGLAVSEFLDLAIPISEGLSEAHRAGVVHRDLKPGNVMVDERGVVKILDFGLSRIMTPDGDDSLTLTSSDQIVGTPQYMAPEQIRGQSVDARCDLFSLGSMLYELASGVRPFSGKSQGQVLDSVLHEEPPPIQRANPRIDDDLARIICRLLAKDPDLRLQTAADLRAELKSMLDPSGSTIAGRMRPPHLETRAGPGPLLRMALVLILVMIGGALGWFLSPSPRADVQLPRFQQLTYRRGMVSSARFAPDGKTIVYGAAWEGRQRQIFTTQERGLGSRSLELEGADILAVSSTGELAVSLDRHFISGWETRGTLARVPLEGGAPKEVTGDVHEADWSPGGEELAVVREVNGRSRLEYPLGHVLYEAKGWINNMRMSPDGDLIAFQDLPVHGDNVGPIAVIDLQGRRSMLMEAGVCKGLAWVPDGSEIWVAREDGIHAVTPTGVQRLVYRAPGLLSLHDVSRSGRALVAPTRNRRELVGLAPGETEERGLNWFDWAQPRDLSADGRRVLFEEGNMVGPDGCWLYVRPTDGSPPVRLGQGLGLALAPDGRWVLAIVSPYSNPRLRLLPTGSGRPRDLDLEGFRAQPWASWLDDQRVLIAGRVRGAVTQIYECSLETRKLRSLTPKGVKFAHMGFSVSRDGKWLAATASDGIPRLYALDGSTTRPIPGMEPGELPVAFTAAGSHLYVHKPREVPARIHRLSLDSGTRAPWKKLSPGDLAGVFDIDRVAITRDGQSYIYSFRRLLSELFLVDGLCNPIR